MSLFDNVKFTVYRDAELEAFYDVDLKNRRKLIIAHVIVYLFPVLIAVLITRIFPLNGFNHWLILFSLVLYIIVIVETVSYLFPKSREFYKKYFLWIVVPIGVFIGLGGYFAARDLITFAQADDLDPGSGILQLLLGGVSIFALFGVSQFGLSQILHASKSLYTRKAKVEADIQFATEIQERILQEVQINHNGTSAYACSYPANELGGDYFELSVIDDELFASIGDISGHSFGAGLLMTMTKSALQTHLEYNREPAEVMSNLNTMLNRQTGRTMYATMVLLKLDLTSDKVSLCNAGHLPVIHIPSGSDEVIYRHKKGIGLGINGAVVYKNLEFDVQKGDFIILYSDGLIETRDDKMQIRDAGFFEDLIVETLKEGTTTPGELATDLLARVRESDHAAVMEDDSSLIVISV
jgi:hypothetical protein